MKSLCVLSIWGLGCLGVAGVAVPAATATPPAWAQDIAVHVQGDKAHNGGNSEPPLWHAKVTLKHQKTNQVWHGETDASGRCSFKQVPLGPYTVNASYLGVQGSQPTNPAVSNVYFKLAVKK